MNNKNKRDANKVQMLIDAGLIKPDVAKLVEITGLSKRALYYWILEDNDRMVSDGLSKDIENKINEYKEKQKQLETDSYAYKKISDALGF